MRHGFSIQLSSDGIAFTLAFLDTNGTTVLETTTAGLGGDESIIGTEFVAGA
ncbi:MAG: hypothetical protein O3A00_24150 [Planctomycetota bacterium]|nr:hypothetical protein [Planctomycetota bacterium]